MSYIKIKVIEEANKYKEAKGAIQELFSDGKIYYYSDIAKILQLDLELVVNICDEFEEEGLIFHE